MISQEVPDLIQKCPQCNHEFICSSEHVRKDGVSFAFSARENIQGKHAWEALQDLASSLLIAHGENLQLACEIEWLKEQLRGVQSWQALAKEKRRRLNHGE